MKRIGCILFVLMVLQGFTARSQEKNTGNNKYPNVFGHLLLSTRQLDFHNVIQSESKTDTIKMFNNWDQVMTISLKELPEYLSAKVSPGVLKPKQEGIILLTFDAAKRKDIGFMYDRIYFETNDSTEAEKPFSISMNIIEDFSKMTPEQMAHAPKIKFETTTFDFDTIREGDTIRTAFKFTNEGDSLLRIRKVKGS
jgi:hypothetical protein